MDSPLQKPNMKAVFKTAKSIIAQVGEHSLSDATIQKKIEEILFGYKEGWLSFQEGLLTREELANLLLAHLDTLVEDACGKRFYTEDSSDCILMQRALFGEEIS